MGGRTVVGSGTSQAIKTACLNHRKTRASQFWFLAENDTEPTWEPGVTIVDKRRRDIRMNKALR
jgi:hypothetical protein